MPASRAPGTREPRTAGPFRPGRAPTPPAPRPHACPRGGGPGHVHEPADRTASAGPQALTAQALSAGRTPGRGGVPGQSWRSEFTHEPSEEGVRAPSLEGSTLSIPLPQTIILKGDRVGGGRDQGGAPLTCRRQWSGPNGSRPAPPPRPPPFSPSGLSPGAPSRRQKQSHTRGLKTGGTGSLPQERGPPARHPPPDKCTAPRTAELAGAPGRVLGDSRRSGWGGPPRQAPRTGTLTKSSPFSTTSCLPATSDTQSPSRASTVPFMSSE